MRRFFLHYALPTSVVLAVVCLPLVAGQRTLYLRDVFGTHLPMKTGQAESLRVGELAMIDPYRGGGQASLGNLNSAPLYPTSLLFAADEIWALNAHFWIHLLLAPLGLYWLARRWGLSREAAWMGGVAYAASGYLLSTLNLYNLVAHSFYVRVPGYRLSPRNKSIDVHNPRVLSGYVEEDIENLTILLEPEPGGR